jgi:arylsulfatase A
MKRFLALITAFALCATALPAAEKLPNIVMIFIDDLGYGDLGCYGAQGYETPNLDRMAKEGVRFTDFYSAQPVCSASRAALMTGCYPSRVSIMGALSPAAKIGLHPDEMTMAELLKQKGYATAIFGKWHLGCKEPLLPTNQGFDEYLGLPYSNDMSPLPEHNPRPNAAKNYPPIPLIEGTKVIEVEPDQSKLTTLYTERSVAFIKKNKDKPFFLYLPHTMVHVPLYVSDKFKGKAKRGLFGDVMEEVDWSVGEILKTLKDEGLDDNTLVMFTSDNGPWAIFGNHAGSAGPLRESKGNTHEGGVREPFIARWPGKIPAGQTCTEPAMTIDIFSTVAKLTGAPLPDHPIDGKDIWPLLSGQPDAKSPHEALFFYYGNNELQAMRSGHWKLMFPHKSNSIEGAKLGADGKPGEFVVKQEGLELYDLNDDVGEKNNVADKHPEVMAQLDAMADKMRHELGDALTKTIGAAVRPAGTL